MAQFATILGEIVGSLIGAILIGGLFYSLYDLFRYLVLLVFNRKKLVRRKTSFIYDLFKYFLIGLPIAVMGNIYAEYPDVRLGAVMMLFSVLFYILAFFLLKKTKSIKSGSPIN